MRPSSWCCSAIAWRAAQAGCPRGSARGHRNTMFGGIDGPAPGAVYISRAWHRRGDRTAQSGFRPGLSIRHAYDARHPAGLMFEDVTAPGPAAAPTPWSIRLPAPAAQAASSCRRESSGMLICGIVRPHVSDAAFHAPQLTFPSCCGRRPGTSASLVPTAACQGPSAEYRAPIRNAGSSSAQSLSSNNLKYTAVCT